MSTVAWSTASWASFDGDLGHGRDRRVEPLLGSALISSIARNVAG